MVRKSRLALTMCCVALAGLVTGCAIDGTPKAAEQDVRKLEVGPYPVDRHKYDQNAGSNGPILEAMRMSDTIIPTVQIDPALTYGRGASVLVKVDEAVEYLAKVSEPILQDRRFVAGYAASGADRPDPPGEEHPGRDATAVTTAVLRFPDEPTAKLAARELEDADIAVSPDNKRLPSTKYPDAYVHWRPGIPTVGVFFGYSEFVISLFIQRPRADSADLVSWAERSLAAELGQLEKFEPTPNDKLGALQVDPDGLLARVVVEDRAGHVPDVRSFATYGADNLVHPAIDEAARQRLVEETGFDRSGHVEGSSVYRVRDYDGAQKLITGLIDTTAEHYDPLDAPRDVPAAKCLQLNSSGDPEKEYKFRCYVAYKRYVGVVSSDDEPDVRQKVAAQYALLANSL